MVTTPLRKVSPESSGKQSIFSRVPKPMRESIPGADASLTRNRSSSSSSSSHTVGIDGST